MKATWNGKVIAESNDTIEVEGNQYFLPQSVNHEFLADSDTTSVCPWKGTASYFDLEVDGKVKKDAAWYYTNPSEAASQIKNYIAFWKGVVVEYKRN
jgi:uncharacterized protein (DUF427 family)